MTTSYMTELTGKVNTEYSKVDNYFGLKKTNEQLAKDNERLRNMLHENFEAPDTINKVVTDSIPFDTLGTKRKWLYRMARVVSNSVTSQENYIELSRGTNQEMKKDLGVVDANNAVVGIVTDVSENFSVVMSLLHKDSHISGKLLKGGQIGTLSWDGKTPNIISLTGIPKSAQVAKGDTIITSGYSNGLPIGMLIGFVTNVVPEKTTSNYSIEFRTAADFYNLQYVYSIDNLQKEEMNKLLDKVKKQNQ